MHSLPLQDPSGLQTLLETSDFDQWQDVVGRSLGHHRSRLLPHSTPFQARIQAGSVAEFAVLLLHGSGQVELVREQQGHAVLWLPLQGWSQETVNGEELLAERGMGLLFRPGDRMRGWTSETIRGVSILLPAPLLAGGGSTRSPLLHRGRGARRVLTTAWQLVNAAASAQTGASFAAEALADALWHWAQDPRPEQSHDRSSARQRHHTVGEACSWIEAHLGERFSVVELSRALQVSVRTLQYGFQQELGCTPMAHAKQLRLQRLRRLLLDPDQATRSIADLMQACGLLACGVTAADYRQWCGESPSRTRQRLWHPH